MKFIKENIKAIILILLVMISESIYLPFCDSVHHYTGDEMISWGDVLYYFISQFGYLTFFPSVILYLKEKNIDSKALYLGLVFYNLTEVAQEANILFKWNVDFLNKLTYCLSDELQIIFIIFTIVFTYIGYKRWHS